MEVVRLQKRRGGVYPETLHTRKPHETAPPLAVYLFKPLGRLRYLSLPVRWRLSRHEHSPRDVSGSLGSLGAEGSNALTLGVVR